MTTNEIQFNKKFGLKNIAKIDIVNVTPGEKTYRVISISETSSLDEIMSELNLAKKSFLSDNRPNYRLLFYKENSNNPYLDIGYQNFSDRPYIRMKYDHKEEEFVVSKKLFAILEKIIKDKISE